MGQIHYEHYIDLLYDVDVFVAGGGPAGIAAAVTAARAGKSVYLAESFGAFGGSAVTMLVPSFVRFDNGKDFMSGGIGREIYDYLEKNCTDSYKPFCPHSIPIELLKICCDDMVMESGAQFSFYTTVIDVHADKRKIDYVVCHARGKKYAVKAKVYIDCTGDGDMSALAGARFAMGGEHGETMSTTLCGLWAGINWKRTIPPDDRKLKEAIADGVFTSEDYHLPGIYPIASGIGGSNVGHIFGTDPTDALSLSQGIIRGRKQLEEYRRYYRQYLEGFENMELVCSAPYLGIRESRRITGRYTLTLDDFIERRKHYDDIGVFSYPVDIHSSEDNMSGYEKYLKEFENFRYTTGETYGIPYSSLTPLDFDNLLVAGRCISADRYMMSSIRVMPCCYITGQAAGSAASLFIDQHGGSVHTVDIRKLQTRLRKIGAFLPQATDTVSAARG